MALADNTAYNAVTLLASGTILALVTSYISEKAFASPAAQLLPYAKYVTIIGYIALQKSSSSASRVRLSSSGRRLVWCIGALSVVAYCLYCVGFALAGTGLAVGMHAAAGQTFTALLSWAILKKRLSTIQIFAVIVVNVGLLLRSAARQPAASTPGSATAAHVLGGGAIIGSSICYALLGVVFDYLLRIERPAPPYSQIMEVEGWLGMAALTAWQAAFTLPRWRTEIGAPLARSGVGAPAAVGLLLASGAIFIWHYYNMTNVFRTDGAVAVGLVNAVRGAAVTLVAGHAGCTPQRPDRCNSFWTVASALVVTLGAALWTLDRPSSRREKGTKRI